ncbi:MAG: single-stranded DNA-binding protein [Ignavibacteriales bacterium]
MMLNQTVIVGRIVRDPELRETESGKKVTNITLAVPRSFKNINGQYDTDFIPCVLWKGIAELN